nr:MAG TPA: hypothetical protein [Caudoviricetes sp.]
MIVAYARTLQLTPLTDVRFVHREYTIYYIIDTPLASLAALILL